MDDSHNLLNEAYDQVLKGSVQPIKVWRAVKGGVDATKPREGYILAFSSEKAVADSYAPEGAKQFILTPSKVIEFPSNNGDFNKLRFDDRARSLGKGEVLVARRVYDIGPWADDTKDPEMRYSYPSDIYATTDSSIVKAAIAEGVDPDGNWEEDEPEDETPEDAVNRIFAPDGDAAKEFKDIAHRIEFEKHLVQRNWGDLVKKYPRVKLMYDLPDDRLALFYTLVEDTIDIKLALKHVRQFYPKAKIGFAPRGDSYIVSDFQHLNPVIVDYTTGYWELECMIYKPEEMPKNQLEAIIAKYQDTGNKIVESIYKEVT